MTNMAVSAQILGWLKSRCVRDICLCPGGRNSPFVEYLTQIQDFQVHTAFDERAAGFFALGLALKNRAPAAIITTSGTAVAEVLPSVMEAHYAAIPLIVISADRPRRLRGTGAPQTVEQNNLFGVYAEQSLDIEGEFKQPTWSGLRPLHLNVCFDEPLIDEPARPLKPVSIAPTPEIALRRWGLSGPQAVTGEILRAGFARFLEGKTKPLLLVGTLTADESQQVKPFLEKWPGPVYCEGTSGLREVNHESQLISGDRMLVEAWRDKHIDCVVRLGGVPTARLWRTLETTDFPIFSFSSRPFPGLSRGEFFHGEYGELRGLDEIIATLPRTAGDLIKTDREREATWRALLTKYPTSEPALVAWLAQQISSEATVYLGNSLPIREWDLVAPRERPRPILANRGANGIDGQISTALAFADTRKPLWVIVGDLTALYDSNAMWFWKGQPVKIAVINNRGGQIFSRMFTSALFQNSHDLRFQAWAAQWSLPYQSLSAPDEIAIGSGVLELQPDATATAAFWNEYDRLWEAR